MKCMTIFVMIGCFFVSCLMPKGKTGTRLSELQVPLVPTGTNLLHNERHSKDQKSLETLKQAMINVFGKHDKKHHATMACTLESTKKSSQGCVSRDGRVGLNDAMLSLLYQDYKNADLNDRLVTLIVKKASLREALDLVAKSADIKVLVDPDIDGSLQDVCFDQVPFLAAIKSLLAASSVRLILLHDDGMWRITKMPVAIDILEGRLLAARQESYSNHVIQIAHLQWSDDLKKRLESLWKSINGVAAATKEKRDDYIVFDDANKQLLIKGAHYAVKEFRQAIEAIDIKMPQIRIDARIIVTDNDIEDIFGINWSGIYDASDSKSQFSWLGTGLSDLGPNDGSGKPIFSDLVGWSLNFIPSSVKAAIKVPFSFGTDQLSKNRLNIVLNAAEEKKEIKTILKPSMLVYNDQTAEIVAGEELPQGVRMDEAIEGKLTNITTVNYKDVGIKVKVTPSLSYEKDALFLDIFVENSALAVPDLGQNAIGSIGSSGTQFNYKIRTTRSKNKVLLKNGQTTMISGLVTNVKEKRVSGIPFLQDIPLLGALFRGSRNRVVEKQLMIFITPTLVDI